MADIDQEGNMNENNNCVYGAIQEYLLQGTLPKPGTVCKPKINLFPAGKTLGPSDGRDLLRRRQILSSPWL